MNAETVAAGLGHYKPKPGGGFMACCPAHADSNPSLAIDDNGGGLLVKCFAGCDQAAVISTLKDRGLWPEADRPYTNPSPTAKKPVKRQSWTPVLPVPADAPEPPATHYRHGKPSGLWRYLSGDGVLLHMVCRFDTESGKEVIPLTFCTNGARSEWRWQAITDSRPLYGLETLGDAERVLLVEGEKAADAARRLLDGAFPVLTWSGGSGAAGRADFSPLAGRTVAIWPDADQPGIKAALALCDILKGLECTIKVAEPPAGVTQGWDLADSEGEGWDKAQVLAHLKVSLTAAAYREKYQHHQKPEQERLPGNGEETQEPDTADMTLASKPKHDQARRFAFRPVSEALEDRTPPEWIVKGIIETEVLAEIFGPPGSGKTFAALDLALCVTSGMDWHGHTVKKSGPVLYVCGEGARGVTRRIEAWRLRHGRQAVGPFFISNGSAALLERDNVRQVEEAADQITEQYGQPVLIIIDTLARNFGPGNENDTSDMSSFVGACDRLKDRHGAAVLVVHHTGLTDGQRGRGSSVLRAAVDFEYSVKSAGDRGLILSATKVKDHEPPAPMTFELKPIALGYFDEDGTPVSSCTLEPAEITPAKGRLSSGQILALETFGDAAGLSGEATLDNWRAEYYRKSPADNQETKRRNFNRYRKELTELGILKVDYDVYNRTRAPGQAGQSRDNPANVPGQSGHLLRGVPMPASEGSPAPGENSVCDFDEVEADQFGLEADQQEQEQEDLPWL